MFFDCRPQLQFEAGWALSNLTALSIEASKAASSIGAIPKLIKLLESPQFELKDLAVWGLLNLASGCSQTRNMIIDHGIVELLVDILQVDVCEPLCDKILMLICALCHNKSPLPDFKKLKLFLPELIKLMQDNSTAIVENSCRAISFITADDTDKRIETVAESGCVKHLVQLLESEDRSILLAALQSIRNIVSHDEKQVDIVLSENPLSKIAELLKHHECKIVDKALQIISNIAAGNQNQVQKLFSYGIFTSIVNILKQGKPKLHFMAIFALNNILIHGSNQQVINLIQRYSVLRPYCDQLCKSNVFIIKEVLIGIGLLLEKSGAGSPYLVVMFNEIEADRKLKSLQNHVDADISSKAFQLITNYFAEHFEEPNQ